MGDACEQHGQQSTTPTPLDGSVGVSPEHGTIIVLSLEVCFHYIHVNIMLLTRYYNSRTHKYVNRYDSSVSSSTLLDIYVLTPALHFTRH